MVYKRWYDYDAKVRTMVKSMEFMNVKNQLYFAEKLLEMSEQLLLERGGDSYLSSLEVNVKQGLEKSKAKKRWYDSFEVLHRAFNNLYALTPEDRQELAIRLSTPIRIVEGYERQCRKQGQDPDIKVVEEILRTALSQGHERARRLYVLYLTDFPAENAQKNSNQNQQKGLWTRFLENLRTALSAN